MTSNVFGIPNAFYIYRIQNHVNRQIIVQVIAVGVGSHGVSQFKWNVREGWLGERGRTIHCLQRIRFNFLVNKKRGVVFCFFVFFVFGFYIINIHCLIYDLLRRSFEIHLELTLVFSFSFRFHTCFAIFLVYSYILVEPFSNIAFFHSNTNT